MPAALLLLAACSGRQHPLDPAGDQAAIIEGVWDLMMWICGAMYLLVLGALAWALARHRRLVRAEGVAADPRSNRLLVAWVVLIIGLLTWLVTASYIADRRLRSGGHDLAIKVTAKQWWWQVEYLDPDPSKHFITANELRLPRGRTVRVELESADVIHSFWVPNLSGKQDLVPGYRNHVRLTPRVNGTYRGQCAEFCGLQHAHMAFDVQVEDDAAFQAWRARQLQPAKAPATAKAAHGARLFESAACAMCHTIRGTTAASRMGPDLTHLASRRTLGAGTLPLDRATLTRWIVDPQHPKPGNHMPAVKLAPQDLDALVDYLMGLE